MAAKGSVDLGSGEEAGARKLAFFRVKWLQPAMKSVCATGAAAVVLVSSSFLFCNEWLLLRA